MLVGSGKRTLDVFLPAKKAQNERWEVRGARLKTLPQEDTGFGSIRGGILRVPSKQWFWRKSYLVCILYLGRIFFLYIYGVKVKHRNSYRQIGQFFWLIPLYYDIYLRVLKLDGLAVIFPTKPYLGV